MKEVLVKMCLALVVFCCACARSEAREEVVVSQTVQPHEGAEIALPGSEAWLIVPAHALTAPTTIRITQRKDAAAPGFDSRMRSALYRFEPAGLTFLKPATVRLAATSDASNLSVFWSTPQGGHAPVRSYQQGRVWSSDAIEHFSEGFIATIEDKPVAQQPVTPMSPENPDDACTDRTVDVVSFSTAGDAGAHVALAIDKQGRRHLSYFDATRHQIKHTYEGALGWVSDVIETLAPNSSVEDTALHVDAQNAVHVAYNVDAELIHAWQTSTGWIKETVASDLSIVNGRAFVMRGNASDVLHFVYYSGLSLRFMHGRPHAWTSETIETAESNQLGDAFNYVSLAFGPDGTPHVSYQRFYSDPWESRRVVLKYAHRATDWHSEVVSDTSIAGGYETAIAVDVQERVHILHNNLMQIGLEYATKAVGQSWVSTPFGALRLGSTARGLNLHVDKQGVLHAGFAEIAQDTHRVLHAQRAADGFQIDEVDVLAGEANPFVAIAFDHNTYSTFAYYDDRYGNLKLAKQDSVGWTQHIVDGYEQVGQPTLFLDTLNQPHLIYYEPASDALVHAYVKDAALVREVVDSRAAIETRVKGTVDGRGDMHIVYDDGSGKHFTYAKRGAQGWKNEPQTTTDVLNAPASIVVDPNNRPHLTYIDVSNRLYGKLRHAVQDAQGFQTRTVTEGYLDGPWSTFSGLQIAFQQYGSLMYTFSNDQDVKTLEVDRFDIDDMGKGYATGLYPALALDAQRNPHITYFSLMDRTLRHAQRDSAGAFVFADVATDVDVSWSSALSVARNGELRLAFYDSTKKQLFHATRANDARWKVVALVPTALDSVIPASGNTLVLDHEANLHRLVHNADKATLQYISQCVH